MIEGGYILQPRCIDKSWIAHSAPVVRETWFFLLRKANHKDIKYDGFIVKRGQLFITYRGIRDALAWKIGYRTKRYSESAMKHTMKLLRRHLMVELTSEPRGNLITICNYDEYQSPENYERTGEQTDEQTNDRPTVNQSCPSINNNDKNVKMEDIEEEEEKAKREEKEKKESVKRIIQYLNEKTGKHFKCVGANIEIITARLNEKYTEEECKRVVDNQCCDRYFIDNPKYLRPDTLFQKRKIAGYLENANQSDGYQ